MNLSADDIALLVGHMRIELFALQKQIVALQERLAELEKNNANSGDSPTGS